MRHTEFQSRKRSVLFAILIASGGTLMLAGQPCSAGDHGHGPIYRTLDALAGGIEKVIDVAACAKQGMGGCDAPNCDDGCDAMTLESFNSMSDGSMPMASEMEVVPMPPSRPTAPHPMTPYQVSPPHMSAPAVMAPQTMAPRMASPEAYPVDSLRPMHSPKPLMAPRLPLPPSEVPRQTRPAMPAPKSLPSAAPEPLSGDDNWLEGSATESSKTKAPTVPRRSLLDEDISPTGRRSPAETFDSLPNPFLDDPQSRRPVRSANQTASYWEPW